MKMKMGVAVLAAICAVLVVTLIVMKNRADDQQNKATDAIVDLSNQVTAVNITLNDYRQANLMVSNDLFVSRQEAAAISNNLVETSGVLTETKVSLQDAQNQITNLDARVADLETQNQVLDQRVADLTNTISTLNSQINFTQIKLVSSETNNAFLEEQLKQQVDEKNELQHKFDDLQTVRTQVKKLRDDALTARRLEWMREGIDPSTQLKGGQLLMQRTPPPTNATPARQAHSTPHNDLNVEVGSDGSVHVIPALPNAPAATNSP
jgi:chromosome segregation ATPase